MIISAAQSDPMAAYNLIARDLQEDGNPGPQAQAPTPQIPLNQADFERMLGSGS